MSFLGLVHICRCYQGGRGMGCYVLKFLEICYVDVVVF